MLSDAATDSNFIRSNGSFVAVSIILWMVVAKELFTNGAAYLSNACLDPLEQ